MLDISTPHNCS